MSIEAMKLALEALESWHKGFPDNMNDLDDQAITALRQAIEQAQNKPDFEKAYLVWQDKTEWVQETVRPHELGMHRADVLRQRIEQAQKQEPVAWLDEEKKVIYWHNTHETDDYHGFKRTRPLYEHPPVLTAWDAAYNSGWNDCLKTILASTAKPALEIVNGQINRSWDAIPDGFTGMLYTSPPQRQPLSDRQIEQLFPESLSDDGLAAYWLTFARAIESAHGISEK